MYSFGQSVINKLSVFVVLMGIATSLASAACCADIDQGQKDQLKDLATQTRDKTRAERQNLVCARRELLKVYRDYNLDEKKAKTAIEKIDQSQLKLLHIHLNNQIGIRNILDASQFAAFRNRIGNKMRGSGRAEISPMREDGQDKTVDKALRQMNLDAGEISQINRLNKQKISTVKSLSKNSRQLAEVYSAYDLDAAAVKKLINDIHKQQANLLNLNLKKQQALRKVMTEHQFKAVCSQTTKK
ncbi:hypothetical protein LLG46_01385 [bacterium]|nr:hypothetical protein [bacterium]